MARPADSAVLALSDEQQAATLLISQLKLLEKIGGDEGDDEIIADMVEGSTDLIDAIGRVLEVIATDDQMIAGIKEHEARLEARRKRFEDRNAKRRWAVENALKLAHKPKYDHPLCGISFRAGAKNSKVEVTNEADLPGEYWRRYDPEVDKRKLLAALKAGEEIDGARLADGEDGHTWRWK